MPRITFSIIILIYNEEKTLNTLLKTLAHSTKKFETEILIIDSQSTDKSSYIIRTCQKKNSNLRYYHVKKRDFNFGKMRNIAVKLARGKYICFISADAMLYSKKAFEYFFKDFQISKKTVAIFGKHIPYPYHPFFFQLEIKMRFKLLDVHLKKNPILIQDIEHPFTLYKNALFIWSFISNVFACYKRSYLIKNPFMETEGFEDVLQGQTIIKKGLVKIYDPRCVVYHSHNYSLLEYYRKQKRDFAYRYHKTNLGGDIQIYSKLREIRYMDIPLCRKILFIIQLFFFYLMKLIAALDVIISSHLQKKYDNTCFNSPH